MPQPETALSLASTSPAEIAERIHFVPSGVGYDAEGRYHAPRYQPDIHELLGDPERRLCDYRNLDRADADSAERQEKRGEMFGHLPGRIRTFADDVVADPKQRRNAEILSACLLGTLAAVYCWAVLA